jgi:PAS domain S-box-containing protein
MTNNHPTWHILHVDNDVEDHILVRTMLAESQGQRVKLDWASSMKDAREKLHTNNYQAVLIDYDLGDGTGIQLIHEFVRQSYSTPMILLTGRGSYEVDVEAMHAGATLYLTKNEINSLLLERSIRYAIERKRTEEKLRFSEEKFLTIFQRSPTPTVLLSFPQGQFVDINQAYLDLVGFEKDDLIGKTTLELGIVRDAALRHATYDALESKGFASGEDIIHFNKNGEQRALIANLERIEIDGRFYILGTMVDVTERQQADQELRQSQERFARAFRFSPAGLTVTRSADGRYLDVNESFCRLTGYTREELIGRTTLEIGFFRDKEERETIVRELRAGRPIRNFEYKIPTRWGETREILLSLEPIVIENQDCLLSAVLDVTERNQAGTELRQLAEALEVERAKLATAIDHLPVGVGIGDSEGRTLSMNTAGLDLHGFVSQEEMFSRLDDYINEFELRRMDGSLLPLDEWPASKAMRGEFVKDYEVRLLNKIAGHESIISYSAAPVYSSDGELILIVYVMQDMTRRKQVEETLQNSETRFRQLADSMPQLVWIARPDGVVEYYNHRYREFDGIAPDDTGLWKWAPVLHPDDIAATEAAWQHSVATGEMYQIEHRVRIADGSYRWHLSRGMPAYDGQGNLVRWYGTATDIHDLKLAQAELAEYTDKLKRSNEELENFALVASHDLQEPLRKIHMFGEGLRRQLQGKLPAESQDYLDRMQNAAGRMQDMIDGLLRLSRVSRSDMKFQTVDMNHLVAGVVSDLEGRIQATEGRVIAGELPVVHGDPLQLRQLMQNLISNALKFHQEGVPPLVEVSGELIRNENRHIARILVTDHGVGFDDRLGERIFHPFVRMHPRRQYEGSGIGLAICRKIVERHGGQISANSQPRKGSVFTVELPGTGAVESSVGVV